MTDQQQTIVALDLEGVLVPEIWINVAERTGIDALRRTTRDEPDYDELMRGGSRSSREHELALPDIQTVIGGIAPLDGAPTFLDRLRERLPGRDPLRHVLRVRGAAHARSSAARRCCATGSSSTGGRDRRLPPAHAGPEAPRGGGASRG